jgi:hypothetical protein
VPTVVVLPASAGSRSRKKAVGAPQHRVGVVDDTGDAGEPRGQQRRHGRIAAEADHGRGSQSAHQVERNRSAGGEHHAGAGELPWRAAAHGLARHHVDHVLGEQSAIAQRAGVGDEANAQSPPDQFDAQRLGGKQMTAGAARGQQYQGCSVHGFK